MKNAYKDFAYNPISLDIPRSKMEMKHSHKTTYNTGQLIPIYWREVLPGSTCKMTMAEVTRMQTPLFPIMDNAVIDTFWFYVPNRLLWKHWEEFMGENKTGFWEQPINYQVPQIIFNSNNQLVQGSAPYWIKGNDYYPYAVQAGSLADYLGVPICDANTATPTWRGKMEVNALPFRAFYKIFSDWFRDENLMYPMEFDDGDSDITAQMGSSDPEAVWCLTPPPQVAKLHDYFTSALPEPQKGPAVMVPLGTAAPIIFNDVTATNDTYALDNNLKGLKAYITYKNYDENALCGIKSDGTAQLESNTTKIGLAADLAHALGATVNQLRESFAVQRFYEVLSRSGSRYIEILKGVFGVTSPDARVQRSEYLGGNRRYVNIDQVVQTSETGSSTPQGNVSAYSLTSQLEEMFTKSFLEHGILMGLQVIRCEHSYQDGINKMFLRKDKFDYYFPQFSNIGEQPIYNKEIYYTGEDISGTKDNEAFGYQEAWAEYRFQQNRVSSEFRSKYHQTLDAWHFADNYGALPTLSSDWIKEYEMQLNRNIAVSSRLADQWMCDIFFKETWTQPMPVYSIPGLLDHY